MSVKKEANGRRSVAIEVEVPGTPEDVWQAIASGPGVSSWFVPTEIDGRVGGTIKVSFGPGMESVAQVTAWDPPRRMAKESPGMRPSSPPMATEWIVEGRAGGTCVVRVVHSLFAATDDWDDQLSGTESGWPGFFRVLRLYLERFKGQVGTGVAILAPTSGSIDQVWDRLKSGLGLVGAGVGARCTAPADAPPLSGRVEWVGAGDERELLLVLDGPGPGIVRVGVHAMGPVTAVMVSLYLYGDRGPALVARDEARWRAWMSQRFPPFGPTGAPRDGAPAPD